MSVFIEISFDFSFQFATRDSSEVYKKLEYLCCKFVDGFVSMHFVPFENTNEDNESVQKGTLDLKTFDSTFLVIFYFRIFTGVTVASKESSV